MARTRSRDRNSKSVKVDFTGVESRTTVPEGDYLVKVNEVKKEEGDKADYFAWTFEIIDGKHEGSTLYLNTSLSPKALWNLRNLLMALGVEVPNGELDVELDELADLELMVVVGLETYEGKKQSRIVDFYPSDDDSGKKDKDDDKGKDDDEDKGSRRRGRDKDDDEDKGSRRSRRDKDDDKDEKDDRSSRRSRRDKDEDDDKGSRRSRRDKDDDKKSKKDKDLDPLTESEVEDMDDDALEETVKDYDLDVDLDDYKSRRKKIGAVIDALEAKDLIKQERGRR